MAEVSVQLGNKNAQWFIDNAAEVTLLDGQHVYLNDGSGKYKKGDGSTLLGDLPWIPNVLDAGTATSPDVKQQLRRDTSTNWTSTNPTLLSGEQGLETDTGLTKMGDGVTAWNSLAYDSAGGTGYALPHGGNAFSPADATVYYHGITFSNVSPTNDLQEGYTQGIAVPKTGAIKAVTYFVSIFSSVPTSETSTVELLRYNSSGVLQDTSLISSNILMVRQAPTLSKNNLITGLNIATNEGDILLFKLTTATWVDNPVTAFIKGHIYIE